MIKPIKFIKEFQLSDEDYGIVENWGDDGDSEVGDCDFATVKQGMEGYWITEMPTKSVNEFETIFVYIPYFDFGTYVCASFVEEITNETHN